MTTSFRCFALKGAIICGLAMPAVVNASSSCLTSNLQGIYNAQISNVSVQNLLQSLKAQPASAAASAAPVVGFGSNDSSLAGNVPAMGRYYFDGAGNVLGVGTGKYPNNIALGKFTLNADCTGKITLNSGAAYDIVTAEGGKQLNYLRTDDSGAGNAGSLRRTSSCVGLNYSSGYIFEATGVSQQADSKGNTAPAPYSLIGAVSLNGTGGFNLSQTLFSAAGTTRSTASGTYAVGVDCSVTFKFSTTLGANSSNFVAPSSFKALMVNNSSGMLLIQPDSGTTLTGSLNAQ
jgi:hypothetical protein